MYNTNKGKLKVQWKQEVFHLTDMLLQYPDSSHKKSLKITREKSVTVVWRQLHLPQESDKKTNNDRQNTTQKTKDWTTRTTFKKGVNSGRVRSSCSTSWHPSYYFCYKSGDKSLIWKHWIVIDKRNIFMFIDDADIMQLLTRSWWQS